MTDLGTLDGNFSRANAINDAGQVVGWSTTARGDFHAFITDPNGVGMIDLGTLGGNFSQASNINDVGQVVGVSSIGGDHAFITGPNGVGMTDLNSLVEIPARIVLKSAIDINNAGQVLVYAALIPEPQSYALMLAGLILIGSMVRRKRLPA
jgi:probable HAF family extracellular repeat protein